jgi:hydrogenase maturation protease
LRIWIAGFGNTDRQDDGVGIILASRIAQWLQGKSGYNVKLSLEHQLLPELAEELGGVDLAIFVDADMFQHESGWSIAELYSNPRIDGFNIHSMSPAWLLELSEKLGTPPKRALTLSVSGSSFDFSRNITSECETRMDAAEKAFHEWFDTAYEKNKTGDAENE